MANPNSDDRPHSSRDPAHSECEPAAADGPSRTFNRPGVVSRGTDYYAQYGMRPTRDERGVDSTTRDAETAHGGEHQAAGLETLEEEFFTREARDHQPRSLTTGVPSDATGPSSSGDAART